MVVHATDGSRTGTVALAIVVTDLSDELPTCSPGSYTDSIAETASDGDLVRFLFKITIRCQLVKS